MTIDHVRNALLHAERTCTPIGPASDLITGGLSLAQAHNICETTIAEREAAGERRIGYKVGFTNIAVREKMGLPDSTYGYLFDTMVLQSGSTCRMIDLIAPKIECEICFRLGANLSGSELKIEEVLAATDAVRATFEICDARIRNWQCPYHDFFADNGFSARIVLGEQDWTPVDQVDLLNEEVILTRENEDIARGHGAAAMGHPAKAVAWLAGKLAERGKSLKAGDLVMTGTLTPILPLAAPATYTASFSSLGSTRMHCA